MNLEIDLIIWVQELFGAKSQSLFVLLSRAGADKAGLLILALAFWLSGTRLGMRIACITLVSSYVNDLLKMLIAQPRPYFVSDRVQPTMAVGGFGMPSDHAQTAAVRWGGLAYFVRSNPLLLLAAVVILLTGLSRVYLGVHTPLQVIIGWTVGFLILIAFIKFEQPALARLKNSTLTTQIALCILAPVILFAIQAGVTAELKSSFELSPTWETNYLAAEQQVATLRGKETYQPTGLNVFGSLPYELCARVLGFGLCGLYFLHTGCIPVRSHRQRLLNLVIGLPILAGFFLIMKTPLAKDPAGLIFIGVTLPLTIGILVPAVAGKVLMYWPNRQQSEDHAR